MPEGNFEWLAKIPIGIMQLGEDLKVRFANDEAKRLMSFFRDPPYRGDPGHTLRAVGVSHA